MSLTLYCNSFSGIDPLHSQQDQKVLMCGSYYLDDNVKRLCIEKNYILDDTLDNISYLNHILGDLTGLYWVWKNTNHEFVGTNQYRRFYDDEQLKSLAPLQKNTIYVSEFVFLGNSCWDQYMMYHGDLGVRMLYRAIHHKSIPITQQMFLNLFSEHFLSICNTFFAEKQLFDRVCSLLFEIIFELYSGSKYLIEDVQNNMHVDRNPNDKRMLAFLAERILNILYLNANHFFGDVNIVPVRYSLLNHKLK